MLSTTVPLNAAKHLYLWRVMEAVSSTGIRSRHVCGQDAPGTSGIATSAIQEFDPVAMTVKTRSGRTYTLEGLSGDSSLGEAAWKKWCSDNDIVVKQDVTGEYQQATPEPTITFKRLRSVQNY